MSRNEHDDSRTGDRPDFQQVLSARLGRRSFLGSGLLLGASALPLTSGSMAATDSTLGFTGLSQGLDGDFHVPEGYRYQVLLRWGDPLFADAPDFDAAARDAASQSRQFGFNNDFIGFLPLPFGSGNADRGLLVVNHEYSDTTLMFPEGTAGTELSREQADADIASLGMSVVEIARRNGEWQVRRDSTFNRRITPWTPMRMSGPAAGSSRLKSLESGDGVLTLGTYGNCAGGVTPWGTVLTGEENVDAYFSGDPEASAEAENYRRFDVRTSKNWGAHHPRWNLDRNPQGLLHMGWIVEIDPFDPESVPLKRTALGRCKHEGCNVHVDDEGRVVAYTGDDSQFEYLYKFVSSRRYRPEDRGANMRLLDEGTLYVARFRDDGSLLWLPLVHGREPLDAGNGFHSQADVLIDLRKAADLLGATPMDRPEDVEVNAGNGHVYAMLTNNTRRTAAQTDAANPRADNGHGQIIEFWPEDGNHAATEFRWEPFILAGNPADETLVTHYHPDTGADGWFSCPDNCAFDKRGNLWVATDGAGKSGIADGVWTCAVDGPARALPRRFVRAPLGAELCGPFFNTDDSAFFCSVQHPGEGSSWSSPSTRWPDFDPALPPRPAVVVISRKDGGKVGS